MTVLAATRPAAPAGGGFQVRRATDGDRAALEAMFGRCSHQTRYRRFHAPVRVIPERYLAAVLSGRPEHYALVADEPSGALVALASAHTIAPNTVEIGILVADGSQGLGLGSLLLRRIVAHARRRGVRVITAVILREQAWILRLLRAYGACETTSARAEIVVTLHLGPPVTSGR
jgi:GNAT superfamily N-acetyltransferase